MPYMHSSRTDDMSTPVEREMARDLAELSAAARGLPVQGSVVVEQAAKVDENGVEYTSSRPPSPPSTGANTPKLRISPCPLRLWSFVPPPNYGVVEDYTIFRSSYPQDRNMEFIKSLEIKAILTLVETAPSSGYSQWLDEYRINQMKVKVSPNKEAKGDKCASSTSLDSICEALLFAMDGRNHPLWIHCNQGRHRTGCVVACLRKIQGVRIDEILAEYEAYAHPKARSGDIALIKAFKPEVVYAFAKTTGFIGGDNPKFKHHLGPDPIGNVYELAHALTLAGRPDSVTEDDSTDAIERQSATMSDISTEEQPVEMAVSTNASQAAANGATATSTDKTESSVVEVERDEREDIENMALNGELDLELDHESVSPALS